MSKRASVLSVGAFAIVLAVLAGGYWYASQQTQNTVCGICRRPISDHARVVAEIGGQRRHVCCTRCAITEALQEKKPLRVISVTDWVSGKTVAPDQAWYIDGSRRVLCDHDMARMDETKHAGMLAFDRCSPGVYAFARREDAEAFAVENGGMLRRLSDLLPGGAR